MKRSIGLFGSVLAVGFLGGTLVLAEDAPTTPAKPAPAAAEQVTSATPKTAAENPGQLKALLHGKSAQAAAAIVAETVKAALDAGGPADAVKERLALIAAAAVNSAEGDAREAVAAALVRSGGAANSGAIIAAITLAAGTADWAGATVKAALAAVDEAQKQAAETASRKPVETLGDDLARKVVAISARLQKTLVKEVPKGGAPQFLPPRTVDVPPRAEKYRGQ